MIEAHTHHALTPMKQAFDDSRWLRQTRDKRSIGIRRAGRSVPRFHQIYEARFLSDVVS